MATRVSVHRERIERVRQALVSQGVQALLVPSAEPHLSEYLPTRWQTRQWLSGFTGSMGTLVVTADRAALFADSRYWEQAAAELDGSGIELVKIPTGAASHHIDWIAAQLQRGQVIAVDGQVLGLAVAQQLRTALDKAGITLRTDIDVINQVWPDRPAPPTRSVYAHRSPHADEPRTARLARVREATAQHGATHHFV